MILINGLVFLSVALNFLLAYLLITTIMSREAMRKDLEDVNKILSKYKKLEKPKKNGTPKPPPSGKNPKMKWKIYE